MIEESVIVQKILISLPMRFDSKILAIEEISGLDIMIVGELHGTLTAYEMRTKQEDPSGKEAAFKASNQKKTSKPRPKSEYSNNDEFDSKEESNFVRKLKWGTYKYKGKLPLKCFECGRISHFSSKCPYAKGDDENNYKKNKSFHNYKKGNNERFAKSKNFNSKEDSNSSDVESDSDNDFKKVLFMDIDTK